MNIRKANLNDVQKITEIAQVLYLDIPDFVWTTEDFIRKQVERGEYYVAEDDGRIAGAMSLRERKGLLYIETLAVAKDIQARGVGSGLVEFAKRFARDNGFKILRTTSFYEFDPRVKDFWLKQEFRLLPEPGEYNGHKFHRLEIEI